MHTLVVLLLGLAAGILVGLMGIGGGTIVVPALVYLLGMTQHMAQGTSLFMQLLPIGLGALWVYWKAGEVDLRAGIGVLANLFYVCFGIFAVHRFGLKGLAWAQLAQPGCWRRVWHRRA